MNNPVPGRQPDGEILKRVSGDHHAVLNPQQLAAVVAEGGPMLVLAAAGTGKTRTLVHRVAALVEKGVPAYRILLLTFTNKAADEMLSRAAALVGRQVGDLWGGTFHHMANRLLRRDAGRIGFKSDYTILDRDDSLSLMKDCVKSLGRDALPKPEVLMAIAGTATNTGKSLMQVIEKKFQSEEIIVNVNAVISVISAYAEKKTKIGAMDFDDLLTNALKLLRENPDVLERYQERFMHVLVDEYQDTNHLQAGIVDCMAARHRNLFVVGDDFQCIYEWRGADIGNIMRFPERYPDAKTYKLEINYRSVPEVLAVANACTTEAAPAFRKILIPTRKSGSKPVLVHLRDGDHQARYVLEIADQLRSRHNLNWSDIAILYRAHHQAMELQMLLARARLPYVITSGVRFFEQVHIKDVCCILRIAENARDEVAFSRILCMLPRIGRQSARKLWEKLGEKFDVMDPVSLSSLRDLLPTAARPAWERILPVLEKYGQAGSLKLPGETIGQFVHVWYKDHAVETFEDSERRLDEIDELVAYTNRFQDTAGFLADVALYTNLEAENEGLAQNRGGDAIRLSTVHQAKGMEWKAVMVLWMVDGMFPSSRTLEESVSGEDEERRLFYVAVTRAKDYLFLCVPQWRNTHGGGMPCRPSRFVLQLPGNTIRRVNV